MRIDEPVAGLRERGRVHRMNLIRTAAQELFAEKGYEQVTTREVAQRAGVGEATLFRYVHRKTELLLLVVGDRIADSVDRLIAEAESGSRSDGRSYIDRIYRIYDGRAELYLTDPDNVTAFVREGLDSSSSFKAESMVYGDRIIAAVAGIVREGQQAGQLFGGVDAATVALNCNGFYVHEITRSPARHFTLETFPKRLRARLAAQLEPLVVERP
ncbi:TetR family transcriptional regulator [Rhodococcus wratislaviensis]|uniref:TetR family transcriptional regulator n=1 Tax=Rhodococcus wratislaviensis TaxID=44752 RepID=A0AB38FCV8_RHOWR|nr:TetR family transcriptional regulator [Rhodococcus wratislaviensis]SPZ39273.1 putative TetR family transcriptional regulator [Rhodococcus wratislaviensis]